MRKKLRRWLSPGAPLLGRRSGRRAGRPGICQRATSGEVRHGGLERDIDPLHRLLITTAVGVDVEREAPPRGTDLVERGAAGEAERGERIDERVDVRVDLAIAHAGGYCRSRTAP